MRALTISFWAGEELILPIAYNELLQGALYSCWKVNYPDLHEEGYRNGAFSFRLFTYSPLQGRYKISGHEICFSGIVSFELRSANEDIVEEAYRVLLYNGSIRLGSYEMPLINLQATDRLLFADRHHIRMLSPVTLHTTQDDGHTTYYSPLDREFAPMLCSNLSNKLKALQASEPASLGVKCAEKSLRKQITKFKGIYITAWLGDFWIETSPEIMDFLYYSGIGDRNSQGFGMFKVVDEQPR